MSWEPWFRAKEVRHVRSNDDEQCARKDRVQEEINRAQPWEEWRSSESLVDEKIEEDSLTG